MDEPLQLFGEFGNPSFLDLLRRRSPDLLPRLAVEPGSEPVRAPHGTTVLALRYRDGVIMAGDRQATEGFQVGSRRIETVFQPDDRPRVAIPGAARRAEE